MSTPLLKVMVSIVVVTLPFTDAHSGNDCAKCALLCLVQSLPDICGVVSGCEMKKIILLLSRCQGKSSKEL